MSDGYQGLSASDRWGCAAAAVVGVPVFFFLLILDALGDCAPDMACQQGFLLMVVLPSIVVAGAVFAVVRAVIRGKKSNDR